MQAVRRVLGRMHAREQEVSNALAETSTFVIHHLQVRLHLAIVPSLPVILQSGLRSAT